jgi:hypothetical protein
MNIYKLFILNTLRIFVRPVPEFGEGKSRSERSLAEGEKANGVR